MAWMCEMVEDVKEKFTTAEHALPDTITTAVNGHELV